MASYEEYLKELENQEKYPWSIYEYLSRKISILFQYIIIVNSHVEELENSLKKRVKQFDIMPAHLLLEYIIHEIQSFYRLAWKNKEKIGITKNDFPDYQKDKVKEFRDKLTGHLEDISNKEIIQLYKMINDVGFNRIFGDYLKFRDTVIKNLKDKYNREH